MDDALNLRFSETVQNKLHDENKDTGTAKFYEGGFQIVAEVPKKVTWDSQLMEEIIKGIPDAHRKDYIKTTYSIDERKYACFPPEYQHSYSSPPAQLLRGRLSSKFPFQRRCNNEDHFRRRKTEATKRCKSGYLWRFRHWKDEFIKNAF